MDVLAKYLQKSISAEMSWFFCSWPDTLRNRALCFLRWNYTRESCYLWFWNSFFFFTYSIFDIYFFILSVLISLVSRHWFSLPTPIERYALGSSHIYTVCFVFVYLWTPLFVLFNKFSRHIYYTFSVFHNLVDLAQCH